MAQSRLEKIGTIFTRVTGLLRADAMKAEDKPIWYDLYEAFPPKLEPRFDRPASNIPIRKIFYEEDVIRAKLHKSLKQQDMVNLFDNKRETQSQQFIKIYKSLKAQGALDEERIFETSIELLQQRQQTKPDSREAILDNTENENLPKLSLSQAFNEAEESKGNLKSRKSSREVGSTNSIGGIDIKNLFKD